MAHKGKFKPNNPQKYDGDPTNIIYRSSYELKFMRFCDDQSNIVKWNSEEIIVPYRSPLDSRIHRYFVDFKITTADGRTMLIEIKPKNQTVAPDQSKKKGKNGVVSKKFIREARTYAVNKAKWEAADKYCKQRGWTFHIFHEQHLGIK